MNLSYKFAEFILPPMNLPSMQTRVMLAILDHSFPVSLLHSFSSFGQLHMFNHKIEDGRPTSGNDVRFGQSSIHRNSREVRLSKPFEDRFFKFWNPMMLK